MESKKVLENLIISGIYFLQDKTLLEEILSFQESINEKIDKIVSSEKFACEKGCYYCCIGWEVKGSIPEILLLIKELNAFPEEKREEIAERLEEYKLLEKKEDIPCPLLENNLCVAYKGRPFVCRTYSSYDKKLCEEKREFIFPDIVEKALDTVNKETSLVEEPFNYLFNTKIPITEISFDKENKLFFLNLAETVYIHPSKEYIKVKAGKYAKMYL